MQAIVDEAPKAKWYFFEFTKIDFVRSLLAVKVDQLASSMPAIRLPLTEEFKLGGPASTTTQNIRTSDRSTLDIAIATPSTVHNQKLKIVKYAFLPSGVHIFAQIE